ncbi:MAG: thiamine pyrophosphate-binding protein [Nitrososphaerales archaeon]
MTQEDSNKFVSDALVDLLKDMGIKYVPLNPGASIRGLHDSIVNYGGNMNPELILCCHETIAVAVASGYFRVTGKPLAVLVHDLEGLLHSTKAVFEASLEREAIVIIGGNGPSDVEKRRPGIDWIHNALVPNTVVRDYVKWDDQPDGVVSSLEALIRAYRISLSAPPGPVYLSIDAELQERPLPPGTSIPAIKDFALTQLGEGSLEALRATANYLKEAEHPVIIADRYGRTDHAVAELALLAQYTGSAVLDTGLWFNFPSDHPLNLSGAEDQILSNADLVIILEGRDIYSLLTKEEKGHFARKSKYMIPPDCKVVRIDAESQGANSWVSEYGRLTRTDLTIQADSEKAVTKLREYFGQIQPSRAKDRISELGEKHEALRNEWNQNAEKLLIQGGEISYPPLALMTWNIFKNKEWILAYPGYTSRGINMWVRRTWDIRTRGQYPGRGGGTGTGIGRAIGVALANRDSNKICIDFQPDGDLLYSGGALWTLSHWKLPLLVVMLNNHTYYNDEEHQRVVALERKRSVDNKTIGIRLEDPIVDFSTLAKSFGIEGRGPVNDLAELEGVLTDAVQWISGNRRPFLIDARINPRD